MWMLFIGFAFGGQTPVADRPFLSDHSHPNLINEMCTITIEQTLEWAQSLRAGGYELGNDLAMAPLSRVIDEVEAYTSCAQREVGVVGAMDEHLIYQAQIDLAKQTFAEGDVDGAVDRLLHVVESARRGRGDTAWIHTMVGVAAELGVVESLAAWNLSLSDSQKRAVRALLADKRMTMAADDALLAQYLSRPQRWATVLLGNHPRDVLFEDGVLKDQPALIELKETLRDSWGLTVIAKGNTSIAIDYYTERAKIDQGWTRILGR